MDNKIFLKSELINFINTIELLHSELYSADFDIEKEIDLHLTMDQKEFLLGIGQIEMNPKADVRSILSTEITGALEYLSNLPSMTVITAVSPTVLTVSEIRGYLSSRIEFSFVLEFEVDRSVVAGAVIEYQGKVGDFSLKHALKEGF